MWQFSIIKSGSAAEIAGDEFFNPVVPEQVAARLRDLERPEH